MNVAPHLIRLYLKATKRYKKLVSRLERTNVSPYQRKTFLDELKKLAKRLRGLQAQLKIAAATGAVVLMLNSGQAHAQVITPPSTSVGPFIRQSRAINPLREPILNNDEPVLTILDFDSDGDPDVVMGERDSWYGGYLRYFENRTSEGSPLYIEWEGVKNPFSGIHASTDGVAPAFADIDEDGDLDLFLGQNGSSAQYGDPLSTDGIEYYKNDGGTFSPQTGAWDPLTKAGNPFDALTLGNEVRPVFIDFDKDGDVDVIIGSYQWSGFPLYETYLVHYYENDGSGVFTGGPLSVTPSTYLDAVSPAVADMDQDGDYDIVLGDYGYGHLNYLRQVSPGAFEFDFTAWDPATKTGNPFDGFEHGLSISPAFVDFNQDGYPDLFVADESGFGADKYSDNIINYYKNSGDGTFQKIDTFENPFAGVFVKGTAAPVLMDFDGDTEPEAVVGNQYNEQRYDENGATYYEYSRLRYFKNETGYTQLIDENNPFTGLEIQGYFSPQFVDVDGDGDRDIISGGEYGEVNFFRNDAGVYVHEVELNPFAFFNAPWDSAARLVDIDDDGDLDLFVTNYYGGFYFYQNDNGTFVPKSGVDNPLTAVAGYNTYRTPFLNFTDIDHDGDLDLFFGGAGKYYQEGSALILVENTGTRSAPVFSTFHHGLFLNIDNDSPQPDFVDYDKDGDLDSFVGNADGTISYLENQNPVVIPTVSGGVLNYTPGDGPVVIDPGLTLADPDNDFIIQATVTIEDFQANEVLAFTQQDISGVFNSATGVLTFSGKATLAEYEALLRTVTFEVSSAGGRTMPSKNTLIDKTITFALYDQDFTNPQEAAKSIEIFINDPPAVNSQTIDLTVGGSTSFDLNLLISDPNGANDLDLSSLKVTQPPPSGAVSSIDANGVLSVDYSGLTFLGNETIVVEVCDFNGACAQNSLTLVVGNSAPVITPEEWTTIAGTSITINLANHTSDVDGNLDPGAFSIVQAPSSGATAAVEVVSPTEANLVIDYDGLTFVGEDQLTIRACDHVGVCTESTIAIDVTNSPPVIASLPVSTPAGTVKRINLMSITSDADDNLDLEAFVIVQAPSSGALATIQVVSPSEVNLLLDYQGITFHGNDAITIRACDHAGACTERILTVQVDVEDGGIIVYNAVAPNSSGNNGFMRITGLPANNKISIFNRWGDKVYDAENYQNTAEGNAFRGNNSQGEALPSGTYFYTIEIAGQKMISGYLTLIQ